MLLLGFASFLHAETLSAVQLPAEEAGGMLQSALALAVFYCSKGFSLAGKM